MATSSLRQGIAHNTRIGLANPGQDLNRVAGTRLYLGSPWSKAMRLGIAVLALFLVPTALAAWPGFHNDVRHSGFQSGSTYEKFQDSWWSLKIDPGTQVDASPIVADGFVVVAGWDGVIRVLDAESGSVKWTATQAKIVGTPVVSGGTLFVVDTTGVLRSYRLDNGNPLYAANVGATFGSLTFHEGKLFIGNEAGVMTAFYADTLTVLWSFAVNSISDGVTTTTTGAPPNQVTTTACKAALPAGGIRGAPTVYDGKVIFGSLNTWVYAVAEQASTKPAPQWIFKTNDAVFGSPTVDAGTGRVLIGSFDEKMYALPASPPGAGPIPVNGATCSATQNTAAWTFPVPSQFGQSKVESTPATDGTKAYFGANNGRVYSVYLSNGTKAWEFATGAAVTSSPAVSNGLVVAGSDDGKLYWLDSGTGAETTSFNLDSAVKASPALDGNKTYIVSSQGSVHMLGPKIPKRADLAVSTIAYDGSALTIIVQNNGNGPAGPTLVRVLVDGAFSADVPVGAIEPGSQTIVTHSVKLTGAHTITATADSAGAVVESQESNNDFSQAIDYAKPKQKTGIPGIEISWVAIAMLAVAFARRKRA